MSKAWPSRIGGGVAPEGQYDDIATGKRDRAEKGGLSLDARMWHGVAADGIPASNVRNRVGQGARGYSRDGKTSSQNPQKGHGTSGKRAGRVVHSVVERRSKDATLVRRIPVSVNGRSLDAQLDCDAPENAVDLETVRKTGPKLRVYNFYGASKWKAGAVGMVWLPVVIGARSEKLRCVVVEDLGEKLIIGLPGLTYLGVKIDFATGEVRIGHRGRKRESKEGDTTGMVEASLPPRGLLVREARKETDAVAGTRVLQGSKFPEGEEKKRTATRGAEELDGPELRGGSYRERGRESPNQVSPVISGRGGKEEKDIVGKHEEEKRGAGNHDDEAIADTTDDKPGTESGRQTFAGKHQNRKSKKAKKSKKSKKGKKAKKKK